jgi:hypothetical protein
MNTRQIGYLIGAICSAFVGLAFVFRLIVDGSFYGLYYGLAAFPMMVYCLVRIPKAPSTPLTKNEKRTVVYFILLPVGAFLAFVLSLVVIPEIIEYLRK